MLTERSKKDVRYRLEPMLEKDEEILWMDSPKPTVRIDIKDNNLGVAGVGGLIAFIGITFFRHSYYDGTFESFMEERVYAVALMVVGLLVIVAPYLITFLNEKRTYYVLSNKRLFFVGKKIKPFLLNQLSGFTIEQHGNGYATIKSNPYSNSYDTNRGGIRQQYNFKSFLFKIKNIRNADEVLNQITSARSAFIQQLKKH